MKKMTRFRDKASASRSPSAFSSISGDLNLANHRIASREINFVGYGVNVQCWGSFGVTGGGGLDYQGVAKILTTQGFFTNILARMSGADLRKDKLSFPIRIGGTMQSPKFSVVD